MLNDISQSDKDIMNGCGFDSLVAKIRIVNDAFRHLGQSRGIVESIFIWQAACVLLEAAGMVINREVIMGKKRQED